jgi:hypothetical protein
VDDRPKQPRIFANKVIRQLIDHLFADGFKVKANDYAAIRVVFRTLGGSWDQLGLGSMQQMDLLQKVVTGWSKLPHEKKSDRVI